MNALANDQMNRIRGLLKPFPRSHTAATPAPPRTPPGRRAGPPGSIRCRPGPRRTRLTRPDAQNPAACASHQLRDARIPPVAPGGYDVSSTAPTGQHWRLVVLDEMHSYSGAKGAEIAMLLRRVRDRVNESKPGRLRFFGTSATLGTGSDAAPRIAEYATDLFGELVEYHSHDERRRDVVTPALESEPIPAPAWQAPRGAFHAFREALASGCVPDETSAMIPKTAAPRPISDTLTLIEALRSEEHVLRLRQLLSTGAVDVSETSGAAFADPGRRRRARRAAQRVHQRIRRQRPPRSGALPLHAQSPRGCLLVQVPETSHRCAATAPRTPQDLPQLRRAEQTLADVRVRGVQPLLGGVLIGNTAQPDEDGHIVSPKLPHKRAACCTCCWTTRQPTTTKTRQPSSRTVTSKPTSTADAYAPRARSSPKRSTRPADAATETRRSQ